MEQALDFVEYRDLDLQIFLDRTLQTVLSVVLIVELLEVRRRGYADIDFDRTQAWSAVIASCRLHTGKPLGCRRMMRFEIVPARPSWLAGRVMA